LGRPGRPSECRGGDDRAQIRAGGGAAALGDFSGLTTSRAGGHFSASIETIETIDRIDRIDRLRTSIGSIEDEPKKRVRK
jgi:hypothetical protein